MLPYKLPEHEAFHPTSFGSSERWQPSTWCRSSPAPSALPSVQEQHSFHLHGNHTNNGINRGFFGKEDAAQQLSHLSSVPDHVHLENLGYSGNTELTETGVPSKWENEEASREDPNPTPMTAPNPSSHSGSGDAFWSSTLSRVAAVAAAAMACAAVPQKDSRDERTDFEETPQVVIDETEKINVKEPWYRVQRKIHGRR